MEADWEAIATALYNLLLDMGQDRRDHHAMRLYYDATHTRPDDLEYR